MRCIVDQHLPLELAMWLRSKSVDATHVREFGGQSFGDREIWTRACAEDAVVITKDADFVQLFHSLGGARVVWVRIRNCTTPELIARFRATWDAVADQLASGDRFVELR